MTERSRFERLALVHMDAAYRLAFWIVRSGPDAEDVVQESFLRAYKHFDSFKGDDVRPWLLAIVRNVAYLRLAHRRRASNVVSLEDAFPQRKGSDSVEIGIAADEPDAEALLIAKGDSCMLHAALAELPEAFREILVLRELEGLSYREIADIVGIPAGTVMSRLARAREQLRRLLLRSMAGGTADAL
ncbi:MAG: sigma-70 family RNA polymerase sigma factor [Hyphomicrobiaceae bacterium]